jgi:ribosomal protein S27AE
MNNLEVVNNQTNVQVIHCFNSACEINEYRAEMNRIFAEFEKIELVSSFVAKDGKYVIYLINPFQVEMEGKKDFYRSQYPEGLIRTGVKKWVNIYKVFKSILEDDLDGNTLPKQQYMKEIAKLKMKYFQMYAKYYQLQERASEGYGNAVLLADDSVTDSWNDMMDDYPVTSDIKTCCPKCGSSAIIKGKRIYTPTMMHDTDCEDYYEIDQDGFTFIHDANVHNIKAESLYKLNGDGEEYCVLDGMSEVDTACDRVGNLDYHNRMDVAKAEDKQDKWDAWKARQDGKAYLEMLSVAGEAEEEDENVFIPEFYSEIPADDNDEVEVEEEVVVKSRTYGRKKGAKKEVAVPVVTELDDLAWSCGA